MRKTSTIALIAAIFVAGHGAPVVAEPLKYALPDDTTELHASPDPGFQAAQGACQACHSADYVLTQPPKKGQAFWDAEVTKMIKTYHATLDEADAKAIADYLAKTY